MLNGAGSMTKGNRGMVVTSAANQRLYCVTACSAMLRIYEKIQLMADKVGYQRPRCRDNRPTARFVRLRSAACPWVLR